MPRKLAVALDPAQLQEPVTWEGWGTSLAWFAVALGNHEQLRRHISALLFGREPSAGLGMNIVRYEVVETAVCHKGNVTAGTALMTLLGWPELHATTASKSRQASACYTAQHIFCMILQLVAL